MLERPINRQEMLLSCAIATPIILSSRSKSRIAISDISNAKLLWTGKSESIINRDDWEVMGMKLRPEVDGITIQEMYNHYGSEVACVVKKWFIVLFEDSIHLVCAHTFTPCYYIRPYLLKNSVFKIGEWGMSEHYQTPVYECNPYTDLGYVIDFNKSDECARDTKLSYLKYNNSDKMS